MSRFDYVKYDEHAVKIQIHFKEQVERLEHNIESIGRVSMSNPSPQSIERNTIRNLSRYRALALTALGECYRHIGKAIREDQILRNGSAPLQEERQDG